LNHVHEYFVMSVFTLKLHTRWTNWSQCTESACNSTTCSLQASVLSICFRFTGRWAKAYIGHPVMAPFATPSWWLYLLSHAINAAFHC